MNKKLFIYLKSIKKIISLSILIIKQSLQTYCIVYTIQ